ncbi:cobaltochelatase subunit CobT [Kiloniella sp. b19]|uniref:cobaltochelatase subunit CobT n=1 Tax=Kiloniella sp. GXU_MW_B19 TaxID=3141326 RepID=UPI0031D1515F
MSKPESPLELFKRVTSSTARAMAQKADLEVNFTTKGRGLAGNELRLPTPTKELPAHEVAIVRGRADQASVRLRFHDEASHQSKRPASQEAASVYDALEQVRCESLGVQRMAGVAGNLEANRQATHDARGFTTATSAEDVPLAEAVAALARQSLTGREGTHSDQAILELWRPNLPPNLTESLDNLETLLGDQEAFARATRDILVQMDLNPGDDPGEMEQEQDEEEQHTEEEEQNLPDDGEQEEQQTSEQSAPLDADSGEAGESDSAGDQDSESEGENAQGQGKDAPGAQDRPPEYDPKQNMSARDRYMTFTSQFDEIVAAEDLCEDEELTRLRDHLDRQLANMQGVIAKLANRLQRRLMAQQTRSWEFNLEEGLLDTARLTRVVIDPMHSLSFKQESDSEFKDTVVTLLIDNSGSMRGRPIMTAAISADILARTLERCGVKVEILGFTTKLWKGGQSRELWTDKGKPSHPGRLNDLRHIIYKRADAPMRRSRKNLGLMLREGILKENIDGEALMWAHSRLMARSEHRRILMVISDGAPVDDSTLSVNAGNFLEDHLREVIDYVENRSPIELVAIGIGHDVTRYYKHAVTINDVEQLGGTMMEKLAELFDEEREKKTAKAL